MYTAGLSLTLNALQFMAGGRELTPALYFKILHRVNVKAYEDQLIAFMRGSSENEGMNATGHATLSDLLHKYCEALEDMERMEMRPDITARSGSKAPELPGILTVGLGIEGQGSKDRLRGLMRNTVDVLTSFLFAFAGGIALIAPMLIMVLYPSRNTSLIVTCVFVFAFAVGLALYSTVITYVATRYKTLGDVVQGSDLKAKEILGATAAYAAVLVVFVGTSTAIAPSA